MAEAAPLLNGTPALDKIPLSFQLGDNLIDGAVIQPMTFLVLAGYITEASGMTEPEDFDVRLRRVRMTKQVTYRINGTTVPMSVADMLRLPITDARRIIAKLTLYGDKSPGKVIRDGDGVSKAIVFELGTPIPTAKGKEPITELEFLASTYGDIEDVLAETAPIQQTIRLLKSVAKPLNSSIQRLPDWALNQITVADGMTINEKILPRFLGSPDE